MFAYDYPLLGVFWTMFMFFIWFAWIILLFRVFGDIFRNDDMGGLAKGLWSIFVLFVPFLGVLIYLIAHGDGMAKRRIRDVQESEAAFQDYVRQAAGTTGGTADELARLSTLRTQGVLTDAEFEQQKAKLLNS
jgi:Short C-terminal domain/Phospholipase_D-nuclease N-terminal